MISIYEKSDRNSYDEDNIDLNDAENLKTLKENIIKLNKEFKELEVNYSISLKKIKNLEFEIYENQLKFKKQEKLQIWYKNIISILIEYYNDSYKSKILRILPAHFTKKSQKIALKRKDLFDIDFYKKTYPDVVAAGIDPLQHYVFHGLEEKRLSGTATLSSHVDDKAEYCYEYKQEYHDSSNKDLSLGRDLGRLPSKENGSVRRNVDGLDPHVYDVIASSFSTDFYLSAYPDVSDADVDPVWHYAVTGWKEGRDPSLSFSTRYYLDTYPDIRDAGINPFYHYLVSGRSEGRSPKHELGFRYDILARLKPVADQIAAAKANRASMQPRPPEALCAALTSAMTEQSDVILSFSHDDFMAHIGGVQLLLRRELKLLRDRGMTQVNFHPIHPLLFMDASDEDILLGATIDGQNVGAYRASDVAKAMGAIRFAKEPTFVIHNLLGHNVDQTVTILEAAGVKQGYLWIHDFAPLYNNYKLMRNDLAYDGVPEPGTIAWQLCEYARADFSQRDLCKPLFEKFLVTLLAPSQSAMDIWNKADVLHPASSQVIEHCRLRELRSIPPGRSGPELTPLKIGYLGHPADHKGWGAFSELVIAFADDPRYEFHQLGSGRGGGLPVTVRAVHADEFRPDRMREAVELEELDVAFVWSLWPETFCLTAYEAIAGGAAILTNRAAGNVCDLVRRTCEGLVLDDEKALHTLFANGDILTFARSRRTVRLFDMDYSNLTVTCLEQRS